MIDARLNYQANIFVNASDIGPTPDNITTLIDIFRDRAFVPNTFQEFSPTIGLGLGLRVRLSSPTNEWDIHFGTNRIAIQQNATDRRGANLRTPGDFCSVVADFTRRILDRFQKRANRVSLVTAYLLEEMTDARLSHTYLTLFRPTTFYEQNPPFEWNWRCVSRTSLPLVGSTEHLNVITSLDRRQGTFSVGPELSPFDRLHLQFDINTVADNTEYRFGFSDVNTLYTRLVELHDTLLPEIQEHING